MELNLVNTSDTVFFDNSLSSSSTSKGYPTSLDESSEQKIVNPIYANKFKRSAVAFPNSKRLKRISTTLIENQLHSGMIPSKPVIKDKRSLKKASSSRLSLVFSKILKKKFVKAQQHHEINKLEDTADRKRSSSSSTSRIVFSKIPKKKFFKYRFSKKDGKKSDYLHLLSSRFSKLSISSPESLIKKKNKITSYRLPQEHKRRNFFKKTQQLMPKTPWIEKKVRPKFQKTLSHEDHFDSMIQFLRRDTNNEQNAGLLDHFKEIVRNQEGKITAEHLSGAMEDLWRIVIKYKLIMSCGACNFVQDAHSEAYENKAIDIQIINERFRNVLQAFLDYAKSSIVIPELEWKKHEDIGNWIRSEPFFLQDSLLSRLLFSCKQSRYTDTIVRQLVLNIYGSTAQVKGPLRAQFDSGNIHFCREIKDDIHIETIQLPLAVSARDPNCKFSRMLNLEIEFHFDSSCYLTRICTRAKRLEN